MKWSSWTNVTADSGIVTAHCYDNALAETINGLYKAELIHCSSTWKTKGCAWNWRPWFNHHRLLESIGNIPPAEAEANYHRPFTGSPMSV